MAYHTTPTTPSEMFEAKLHQQTKRWLTKSQQGQVMGEFRTLLITCLTFWLDVLVRYDYRNMWEAFVELMQSIGGRLFGLIVGLLMLLTFPLSFLVMVAYAAATARKKRLRYLRANRRADADI